ncbi:MAG: zf-HC2 domain-containing protein [Eubacteriales bacterium]|nr:zf-HC2 domain-containing protein [Eubacteriales bacterium]
MDCKTAQQKIMPYIERQLKPDEMEDFIEHIQTCKTCSEELEVYFTIYYALETLDQDDQGSFNIKEMLERDLKRGKAQIERRNMVTFVSRAFRIVTAVLAVLFLVSSAEAALRGGFEETTLYRFLAKEPEETEMIVVTEMSETKEEQTEPETNRKRQVIVKIPETEAALKTEETGGGQ